MKIAYSWISSYLPKPIAIEELSKILTSIGLEVEGIEKVEQIKGSLKGLVIGEVLECAPHPNADKLKITEVSIGSGDLLKIVCGAPNVAKGQKVVVAPVGSTVHPIEGASFPIKKAKIRGEESAGMICAEDEIGLGKSHEGILILPEDAPVGTLAAKYFNIAAPEEVLEIGLTPNRSDAMSHVGVARDVAAYLTHHTKNVRYNVVWPPANMPVKKADLPISVSIEDTRACPRYMGVTIAGVTVGTSPEWLQKRLNAIGVRPINNIVDVTNFVLHELGQPIHAFDYDKIAGKKIRVRKANEDEKFITLDEKERQLQAEDLLICDEEKAMCLAGIYGGLNSGVTPQTRNIFLESAYFDAKTIRRSSMAHGLRTDAAIRFEKGIDFKMIESALKRAATLITEVAGGKVASDMVDVYPTKINHRTISTTYNYINKLCGKNFEPFVIDDVLVALGFKLKNKHGDRFEVVVPGNKSDVFQPADLAEEILRIDGLDNVPMSGNISFSLNTRPEPIARKWKEKLADHLCQIGMHEIVTNSITNSAYYPEEKDMVHMLNSLSSELDVLRPQLLESGLEVLSFNINRKQQDLMMFEIGNVYRQKSVGKYEQLAKLGIWLTGNQQGNHWQNKPEPQSVFFAKGVVERIMGICGIQKVSETETDGKLSWHKGKSLLAQLAQVRKDKLKAFDIKQNVFYIEVDIKALVDAAETTKTKYAPLPKYPSMTRDLALVISKEIRYQQIADIVQQQKLESLKHFELFDVFESEKLGNDKKSLALSFTFQDKDKTLTDQEVDALMQKLIKEFEKGVQASIRD